MGLSVNFNQFHWHHKHPQTKNADPNHGTQLTSPLIFVKLQKATETIFPRLDTRINYNHLNSSNKTCPKSPYGLFSRVNSPASMSVKDMISSTSRRTSARHLFNNKQDVMTGKWHAEKICFHFLPNKYIYRYLQYITVTKCVSLYNNLCKLIFL